MSAPKKKVKVRIRNTSGDVAFDLNNFQSQIENAYRDIGYEPTSEEDFGFLIDVNVKYSMNSPEFSRHPRVS